MEVFGIEAGNFKLDGGAMYGIVPKTIWSKYNTPDLNNRIDLSARCLLISHNDKLILVDTGIGYKQSDKFYSYYDRSNLYNLEDSLKEKGFRCEDITDVFLTHLHFDHCGGAFRWQNQDKKEIVPIFENARYWTNKAHWDWATIDPNPREKASFFRENIKPFYESGKLNFVEQPTNKEKITYLKELDLEIQFSHGHTEAQMHPYFTYKNQKFLYSADLIAQVGNIPLPYVMGYDVRPLQSMEDKKMILEKAIKENIFLYFQHDSSNEICSLKQTEKGIIHDKILKLGDL